MIMKLAVSGKMGSGKSSFYKVAKTFFPMFDGCEAKFALPLYMMQDAVYNTLGTVCEKDGVLLQFLGDHFKDKYGEDFFIKEYAKYELPYNTILTDLRFPSELEWCKENGYTTIRILRQRELRMNNMGNRNEWHKSEIALDNIPLTCYDYVINNNGSLDLFEGAVVTIINKIGRNE